MGNCINTHHFPPLQKIKGFICCEVEGLDLGLPIGNVAAYGDCKSQAFTTSSAVAEVQHSPPPLPVRIDHSIVKPADKSKLPKATIVVSKQQLELILRKSKNFGSKGIAVQFSDRFKVDDGCPRWHPALPTIPEVRNY
ncbi:hypothetical protein E5676_scaffold255G00250 [Cucumis melo var. makuwa]|uniref:Uncharacterized protein n=2 Tax=Cucumis melo TaxID=3656 RepID=A0A5D3CLY8_CUCMM|nr:hypothetical protein E6C27_scaffold253G00640 [Cucumis melo var. makuwa]TYK12450.1 hypothetical protein E5676_scaffold255G00250 [Cucumis melo var. makuwa]